MGRTTQHPVTTRSGPVKPAFTPGLPRVLDLQQAAGNAAIGALLGGTVAVQREPRKMEESLDQLVVKGKFREALEFLNSRSMEDMLNRIENVGFANASYLLGNLGAASWLGPVALARLEVALRTIGIRQTGTAEPLVTPLLDALDRSGVRNLSDQFAAIQHKVMPPRIGWPGLARNYLSFAELAPFAELTSANSVFRMLDFISDAEMNQVLRGLNDKQLRLLITANKVADRYDGERIRGALDSAWKSKFPSQEAPWPKTASTPGLNVGSMSTMDKLAEAIKRSEKYGGDEVKGKLSELLQLKSLMFMAGTTIVFAVLEVGTAGAATPALLAISAIMVGPEVLNVASDINGFISTAIGASTEADLEMAGQYFAKAAVAISIDILTAVLLHKGTKAATPKIQQTARAASKFIAEAAAGTGELFPALAMAGDGPPTFFQAPKQRIASYESRRWGGAKSLAEQIAQEQAEIADRAAATGERQADQIEAGRLSVRPEFKPPGPSSKILASETPGAAKDPTYNALMEHVQKAQEKFAEEGFTENQTRAIERQSTQEQRDSLRAMYYGDRIDSAVKSSIVNDLRLNNLGVSEIKQPGPDFYNALNDTWYDITTARDWARHVKKYGAVGRSGRGVHVPSGR